MKARTSSSCRRGEPDLQRAEPADPVRRDATLRLAAGLLARVERPLGPFVTASISFEIPLGNNAAKGRLAQAQATLRSSRSSSGDRTWLIGDNITGVVQTLRAAAEGAYGRAKRSSGRWPPTTARAGAAPGWRADAHRHVDHGRGAARRPDRAAAAAAGTRAPRQAAIFEAGQLVTFTGLGDASESPGFLPTEFVVR